MLSKSQDGFIRRTSAFYNSIKGNGLFITLVMIVYRLIFHKALNPVALRMIREERLINYLNKYQKAIDLGYKESFKSNDLGQDLKKVVWTYWAQGASDMPVIVERCIESQKIVIGQMEGWRHIVLSDNDLDRYVKIPPYIKKKYKKGIISTTHYSDILRYTLISRYGGIWLDATVYLTAGNSAPLNIEMVSEQELFFVQMPLNVPQIRIAGSWIIKSNRNNPIILAVRDMLYEYWKKENYIRDYFLVDVCVAYVLQKHEEFHDMWDRIPYFDGSNSHRLDKALNEKYIEERWISILESTCIHKLSWKDVYKEEDAKGKTFYRTLIDNNIDSIG